MKNAMDSDLISGLKRLKKKRTKKTSARSQSAEKNENRFNIIDFLLLYFSGVWPGVEIF